MNRTNNKKNGFTLVELSIVIIIIALIIAGIIVGQELIKSAEVRGIMRQLDEYNNAINGFKLKYNYLPGDFPNNPPMLPNGVTTGGDGDGYVGASWSWQNGDLYFWQHLSAVGSIKGSYTGSFTGGTALGVNIPMLANNKGGLFVYYSVYLNDNAYWLGIQGNSAAAVGSYIGTSDVKSVFIPDVAWRIDTKLDDGLPLSGKIISCKNVIDTPSPWTGSNQCIITSTQYNLQYSPGNICQLRFAKVGS